MIKKVMIVVCLIIISCSTAFAGAMDDLLINGVRNNDMNMIKTAIANGADVNYKKGTFDTPLLITVRKNKVNTLILDYLLKNGADPNLSTQLRNIQIDVPIVQAARISKDLRVCQLLLDSGADINAQDESGYTPLRFAVANTPNIELTRYLLSKNADINKANNDGITPLMVVAKFENGWGEGYRQEKLSLAKILLNAGADPSMLDKHGKTALQYAIDSNFTQMINLLLAISPK